MYFKVSFDSDFDTLMMHLWSKYGRELFDIDGIGKQCDMNWFAKNFFNNNTTTADTSVDSNSNVIDKNINVFNAEFAKPFQRYNSYYLLWKEMKKLYGLEKANQVIEDQLTGAIYINDFSSIGMAYCFNYSTYDIALGGLPMIQKITSVAPKHLYSFKSQIEQFTIIAANSTLGATGLADFLVVMSYYVENILLTGEDAHFKFATEEDIWTYVKETLASIIYTLNQPTRSQQSPFSNISLFDDVFLNNLCADYKFIRNDETVGVNKDIVKKVQSIFCDVMNETLRRTPCTFPVATACCSVDDEGNILDPEFVDFIAEKNLEFAFINIFCGKSSVLSSCCFSGNQKVLTKSSNGVFCGTFDGLNSADWRDVKRNFKIYHNGSWVDGKLVKIPYSKGMIEIETANGKKCLVTPDHVFPTMGGDKKAEDITRDDHILFNTMVLGPAKTYRENLSYDYGVLIGAYLGDGSIYRRGDISTETTLSLSLDKWNNLRNSLEKALAEIAPDQKWHTYDSEHNVIFVKNYSAELSTAISRWVSGSYAPEKRLNLDCLLESVEFRKGILHGYYTTDGGNSNRIYSTSKKLIDDIEVLCVSLGLNTVINESDRTDEPVIIRGKSYTRNHALYCIRWYSANSNKRSMRDVYKVKNNCTYFKVKSIETKTNPGENVYCFEMKNEDEPYFTLPNGLVTHNCRLRSETTNEYFNSFGSGSSKIGSLGVVSMNLPRVAMKANSEEEFLTNLKNIVADVARINNAKRHIIKKRIDLGAYDLYTYGFMDLKRQYSTCGVTGLNECCEILGYDILKKSGQDFVLRILDVINKTNDEMQARYKMPHNSEQVPNPLMWAL